MLKNSRAFWVLVLSCFLAAPAALAQISVEVRLEQNHFLPTETMEVSVRITNRTGQTLTLGTSPDWLVFTVEGVENKFVQKIGEAPVTGAFKLDSSKVAVKRVNVAPYFMLDTPGRYQITATVNAKEWGLVASSAPKSFDIIEGTRLWTQEVGAPKKPGSGGPLEIRRYVLQQANYLPTQLRLYLRVTDVSGLRTFRVVPIGQLLSFSRPEGQVDSNSNLHVLYQHGPRSFLYTSYDTDGNLLLRQTYDFGESRPRLDVGRDERIFVAGGVRRQTQGDYPAPPPRALRLDEPDASTAEAAETHTNSATGNPGKPISPKVTRK